MNFRHYKNLYVFNLVLILFDSFVMELFPPDKINQR